LHPGFQKIGGEPIFLHLLSAGKFRRRGCGECG